MKIFAYNDFILKKKDGNVYADDSHILFIKSACQDHFDDFCLGSRIEQRPETGYYFYSDKETHVLEFPFYSGVSEFLVRPKLLFSAWKLLKSQIDQFDVFWVTWPHPISFLILYMIGPKKPVILFVRQNLEALINVRYSGIKRWIGVLFVRLVYWYAAKFRSRASLVTVGEEMHQVLAKDFKNSKYISDSIVPEEFALEGRKSEIGSPLKLLFVGRLEPEKGLLDLIHSIRLINEKVPVTLTLIGEGVCKAETESLAHELGLGSRVNFSGYVPFGKKLFEAYTNHDILMISSYSEGLPKIINEARAFAIPVVSTKVGGISNELKNGETCLFVAPGQPQQLADAALRLVNDPDLYTQISRNLSKEFQQNSLEYWSSEFADFVKKSIPK